MGELCSPHEEDENFIHNFSPESLKEKKKTFGRCGRIWEGNRVLIHADEAEMQTFVIRQDMTLYSSNAIYNIMLFREEVLIVCISQNNACDTFSQKWECESDEKFG
jgi:hypothetical protein